MDIKTENATYIIKEKLNQTSHLTVYYAEESTTNLPVVVRLYPKNQDLLHKTESDWNVIKHIEHPLVPKFVDFFSTNDTYCLITEFFSKMNLTQYLNENSDSSTDISDANENVSNSRNHKKCISEEKAAHIVHQLLTVISFLHQLGVSHCGINTDNILIDHKLNIRLTDFSNSSETNFPPPPTAEYLLKAPEVVMRQTVVKSSLSDTFNIGVLIYLLVEGEKPWGSLKIGKASEDLCLLEDEYLNKPLEKPLRMSAACFGLVEKLLEINPNKRYSCEQALNHYWISRAGANNGKKSLIHSGLLKRAKIAVPVVNNRVFSPDSSAAHKYEQEKHLLKLPEKSLTMVNGAQPQLKERQTRQTRFSVNQSFMRGAQLRPAAKLCMAAPKPMLNSNVC